MIRFVLAILLSVGIAHLHGPWWMYVLTSFYLLSLTTFNVGKAKIL